MKTPDIPANEASRLEALGRYDVLDTDSEPSFDALTKLASAILEVPIALVSLVDADRQWFKSRYGLEAKETPREVSFCGHVVAREAPLIVKDAFEDSRFADNPLSTGEPRVRFYAGMPLRTADGFVLGTLCAIDHVPRQPTNVQLEMLSLLASQVVDQLEARRQRNQLALQERAARSAARRLEILFDAMTEGVVVQDATGAITKSNSAAERILGLTIAQMEGKTSTDPSWSSIREDGSPFPGEEHPAMLCLRTGKTLFGIVMGVRKPSGTLTWISINALPFSDENNQTTSVITTFHDITATKDAQSTKDQLALQERLITIGTLASGVGHEINNPLAYVLSNIEHSMEEVRGIAGGSPAGRLRDLLESLAEAREGSERIRKIVHGMRSLAREQSISQPIEVEAVVDVSLNMAAHEIRQQAKAKKSIGVTPLIIADESRLAQVIVNLLVNAAQSFTSSNPEQNLITVTSALESNGKVSITVADNGPGIEEGIKRRIFDPFFTTKPVGQGTGLGLPICQSIVTSLGGTIDVDSAPGRGTSFRVLLPAVTDELTVVDQKPSKINSDPVTRARVLVIDDEPTILRTIRRSLEKEHDVVTLEDPREALSRLLDKEEHFDVIFCDIMMPHLSGDVLYNKVRETQPLVAERIVFITGGATAPSLEAFLLEVPNERMEKPFNLQNIRGIVRRFARAT